MQEQQNTINTNVEYVDDRDLNERTPFSRSYWQQLRQKKKGPAWRKIGRRCVYRWADVVSWLESQPAGE